MDFFHPRDWTDSSFDQEHENDMEGLLSIVRKDGTPYGRLEGMVTVFHNDFYSFVSPGSQLPSVVRFCCSDRSYYRGQHGRYEPGC